MLNEYSKKRDFKKTREPRPKTHRATGQLRFVIQKHAARRLHYDFRLEAGGVLLSWAVPKGPSLDPAEKRLAVRTEDHPFDYKDFEGVIPKGQYGGGEVIIWDEGTFVAEGAEDLPQKNAEQLIAEGIKSGKLSFTLHGTKLQGSWALVKIKSRQKNADEWLLLKHKDEFADTTRDVTELSYSVASDQSIETLKANPVDLVERGKSASSLAETLPGSKKSRFPKSHSPMLASLVEAPFTKEGWIYEPKLDGIRAIAYIRDGEVEMSSRRGLELTERYPSVVAALSLNDEMVLDGEIVALDSNGRPSFQLLQQRSGLSRSSDVSAAERDIPVIYYVFDILYYRGRDLTNVKLKLRRELLSKVLPPRNALRLVTSLDVSGEDAFSICVNNGLEGTVAKSLDGVYESGRRSKFWLKVKATQTAEFIICGYTEGAGTRSNLFGSLVLGYYDEKKRLKYAGNVGTGFDQKSIDKLLNVMHSLKTDKSPFSEKLKGRPKVEWLKPSLVAEIKYAEWTNDRILRSPVFIRLREDIAADETGPQDALEVEDVPSASNASKIASIGEALTGEKKQARGKEVKRRSDPAEEKMIKELLAQIENNKETLILERGADRINLSSLNKELWPGKDKPVTKRDYLRYLIQVSPYILPHLKDRPLTLVRFPDGIYGERFYQKHWPRGRPKFVETVTHFSEAKDRDQEFLLCNNLSTLIWLAQIADLELHTAHSRIDPQPDALWVPKSFTGSVEQIESSLLNYPDFIVVDLDPYLYSGKEKAGEEPELHEKGFSKACEMALALKESLDAIKVNAFVKTSGKTGLHIYIPVVRNLDYDTVRNLAEAFGRFLLSGHPEDVTMEWAVKKRTGKVFFDHNMNARGKTLASIYSTRNHPYASVSVPLDWKELGSVYPLDFTVETVPERLKEVGDLWQDILENKNNLLTLVSDKVPAKEAELADNLGVAITNPDTRKKRSHRSRRK